MLFHQFTRKIHRFSCYKYNSLSLHRAFLLRTMSTKLTSNEKLKNLVGIAQMRSTNDKNANLDQIKQLVQKAKSLDVQFLFLPECCDFVGENRLETLALSEPLTKAIPAFAAIAKENNIWLSLGGIHESILDSSYEKTDKIYNSHVIIDSSGEIVKVYHKLHLFDVATPAFRFRESDVVSKGDRIIAPIETPIGKLGMQISYEKTDKIYNSHVIIDSSGEIVKVYHKLHLFDVATPAFRFRESDVVSKGDRIIAPIETPIGKLGMQICYDIRFAEPSIELRKLGAEILTYPSAFAFSTGQAHWEVLLRARAIENQCYVIAPAQIGFHNSKRQSYGHAMIVDPWGEIVACSEQKELDIITAQIDLDKLNKIRQNMPCFEHRRNDVYTLTAIETAELENVDRAFGPHIIPKSTIFLESPYCYAFTNLRCVVKGHVLVSTKRPAPRLQDLKRDEISDLFSIVCKIQKMLEEIYCTSAATVTVQDGPDAGQTINHVHFHVMPRRPGDFGHNDQIYTQLEKICESEDRNITEMIAEAEMYRNFIDKNKN